MADVQILPSWETDPARTHRTFDDWRHTCRWIAENTPPEACFITPKMQQTFKWYAERSEVCCWKDVPQDARELVEWWQRLRNVYPRKVALGGLAAHGEQALRELAQKYGADYVVLDRCTSARPLRLRRVYPPAYSNIASVYEVYSVHDQ